MKWEKISSKIVYQNKWLKVREDSVIRPDGKRGIYGVVERSNANFIIALNEKREIYFIREYRYPVRKLILQLPSGSTEKEENDLEAAKKELLEETGIQASKWEKLGSFYIGPGHETISANVFLATDLELPQAPFKNNTGEEDILETVRFSIDSLKKAISSNKIECGITLAALNLFFTKTGI